MLTETALERQHTETGAHVIPEAFSQAPEDVWPQEDVESGDLYSWSLTEPEQRTQAGSDAVNTCQQGQVYCK